MRILNFDGLFLRDDVAYNAETEVAIERESPLGLFRPRWDGTGWVEDMTAEEIQAIKASVTHEPTESERLESLEMLMLDVLWGGF